MKRGTKRLLFQGVAVVSTVAMALLVGGKRQEAHAASANGTARASVIAAIAIANVSDLDFGEGIRGDTARVVAAGSSENSENGSFSVTGEPNRTYTVSLPSTTVTITTGTGTTADEQLSVGSFSSNPNGTGTLSASGAQTLLVGGTRGAISATQVTGAYTGTYTVSVVY